MLSKFVDDMKKNRFSIFIYDFVAGYKYIKFKHNTDNLIYSGAVIITVNVKNSLAWSDCGGGRYINSFKMSSGVLTAASPAVVWQGGSYIIPALVVNSTDLAIRFSSVSDQLDMRVDVEFLMPNTDYMIYNGLV